MKVDPFHNPAMNEEAARDMPSRSFEERVFARFDSLDARMDSLDARVEALESQAERRALETKPIWERALAEISEVKVALGEVKDRLGAVEVRLGALEALTRPMVRKVDILTRDVATVRAEQLGLEDRVEKLEPSNV